MLRSLLIMPMLGCMAASPTRPTPTGALADLDYFVGRWHAEAKNPSTGQTFTLDYRVEPALRGTWYVGTGSALALDLEIHDMWGKDPVSGEIVRTIFDSARTFGTVRSRGWQGDTLVLEGDAATTGGTMHVRETITRKGPDEFHAVWEMRTGETWAPYSIEVLRRVNP